MDKAELLKLKQSLALEFQRQQEEYAKNNEALERVLSMLKKAEPISEQPNGTVTPTGIASTGGDGNGSPKSSMPSVKGQKRIRGTKSAAVSILGLLPHRFTKNDVQQLVEARVPKLKGLITSGAMRSAMTGLVEDGFIQMVEPAYGTKPATYVLGSSSKTHPTSTV